MFEPRWYRDLHQSSLTPFTVSYRETDLWIGVPPSTFTKSMQEACFLKARQLYLSLEEYVQENPVFLHALAPCPVEESAPRLAKTMAQAAQLAAVGPMAAVAGAVAQEVALYLQTEFSLTDVIVENGGDIYLATTIPRRVALSAGSSPLSNILALEILPSAAPLGICTSSGTVGHSLSFGKADAITILAKDAAVADAYATAVGNMVKTTADIDKALRYTKVQKDILGTVIIIGDRIGFHGNINVVKA